MKLRLLLLSTLLLSFAFQEPAPEDHLWKQIAATQAEGKPLETRRLLQHLIKTYPKAVRMPAALFQLAATYGTTPDENAAALDCLRRLNNDFPNTDAARSLYYPLQNRVGWGPSQVVPPLQPGERMTTRFTRREGPDSTFSLYAVPDEHYVKALKDLPIENPPPLDLSSLRARAKWVVSHGVEFKRGGDPHADISRSIGLDVKRPGFYILEELIDGFRFLHRMPIHTFAAMCRPLAGHPVLLVLDHDTGAPIAGAKAEILFKERTINVETGADGFATFEAASTKGRFIIRHGGEALGFDVEFYKSEPESRAFITTDRPVYRPGQAVLFKALRRDLDGGKLSFKSGGKIGVEVRDPDGRLLQASEAAWSDTGSITGSFKLGDEPPLGDYRVVVKVPRRTSYYTLDEGTSFWEKTFRVAEYRKPEFQVFVDFADPAPVGSTRITATIRGEYYFGGPVAGAEVEWNVEERWMEDEYDDKPRPPFEDRRAWFYAADIESEDIWSWYSPGKTMGGTGRTGPDGKLTVAFEPPPDFHTTDYRITATLTDASRLAAEGSGVVSPRSSSLSLSIGATRIFYKPGETIQARLRVTVPDGSPARNQAVDVTAFVADDLQEQREFESFFNGTARTDDQGYASFDIPAERAGCLRLRGRTKDKEGRVAQDRSDLWIAGPEAVSGDLDGVVNVLPDKVVYEEGETARFLLRSRSAPLTLFMTVEGDTLLDRRVIPMKSGCEIIEVPIKAEHAPNVYVKFSAWQNGRQIGGGFEISVYPKKSFIDVGISTDRASYGPRQKAKVTLSTRIADRPEPAEVELAIVDESIFAIRKDDTGDIRLFFHRPRANISWDQGSTTRESYCDTYRRRRSYGAGALTGATFSLAEEGGKGQDTGGSAVIRSRFADTLHWSPAVKTGKDGLAVVELDTPDTLTTWRIVARAVSSADRFGTATSSTLTRKDVILRLATPRFYTERDSGVISTVVHSDLPQETEFTVRMKLDGAEGESGDRKIKVPAHGQARLDWKVKAVQAGTLKIRAEALSKAESDGVEIEIPIRPHGIERQVARSARVIDTWRTALPLPDDAKPESASMDIVVTSSTVAAITEALPWLAGYPYGCVEQTMSKFLPSVVAAGAMKRLKIPNATLEAELPSMVDAGLQRLYGFQHAADGGWGWWAYDATDEWMTAYVVYGLSIAKKAGFAVDAKTLERGLACLQEQKPTPFALFARSVAGENVAEHVKGLKPADAEEWAFLVLAGAPGLEKSMPDKVPQEVGPDQIRAMAMSARALFKINPRDERLGTLTEWLLANRRGGTWHSTLDTAWCIFALTDLASNDTEPEIRIKVNGREVASKGGRISVVDLKTGDNAVEVTQKGGRAVFGSAVLRYYSKSEHLAPERGAFTVTRKFERAVVKAGVRTWEFLESGGEVRVGEEVRVTLDVRAERDREYVMTESPLPAGTEAREDEGEDYDWFNSWYGRRELRDDRVAVAGRHIGPVASSVTFRLRPTLPGEYHVMPALAFAMYEPTLRGTSGEFLLRVVDK